MTPQRSPATEGVGHHAGVGHDHEPHDADGSLLARCGAAGVTRTGRVR